MPAPLLLLLLPLLHLLGPALAEAPDRYAVRYARPGAVANAGTAQEYIDPTYPLSPPPPMAPTCTVPVLSHSFANTYGAPPATAAYAPPPGCPAPWSRVVLSFSVEISGDQYDRVAAVWLDGAELLRTTTAEPTPEGIRWTVRKDVTRYSALLRSPPKGVLSVMLENLVNDVFTGLYNVTVSLEFYGIPAYLSEVTSPSSDDNKQKLPESYFQAPADLILPISEATGDCGYWFRIQNSSDSRSRLLTIPLSAYRAVLEVFVSPHSNDEFWYSNPPDLYIETNNLSTGRGNAAYREVVVTLDRRFVGSFVPFPVIYTGGINPLYWQPVTALGAFDLPTYDIELTPFLGILVDKKAHEIGISVVDGIAEWLVDANLHLWLDPSWTEVEASLGRYETPRLSISRSYSTQLLNGSFSIRAKRKSFFSGWVRCSLGNLTTEVETEVEAKSLVKFTNDGTNKTVELKVEQETEVVVRSEKRKEMGKLKTEAEYPLWFYMDTEDAGEDGVSVMKGSLSHTLDIETKVECGCFENEAHLVDKQTAEGWMLVKDHDVINGSAKTSQKYSYSDDQWEYKRSIDAVDGVLLGDNVSEKYSAQYLQAAASACLPGRTCDGTASAAERRVDIAAM